MPGFLKPLESQFLICKTGSVRGIPSEWSWGGSCLTHAESSSSKVTLMTVMMVRGCWWWWWGDAGDDDEVLELVEVWFCREGGSLKSKWEVTGSRSHRESLAELNPREITKNQFPYSFLWECSSQAVNWGTLAAPAASQSCCKICCMISLIVEVILPILGISPMSCKLLAWGHSQFQHWSKPHSFWWCGGCCDKKQSLGQNQHGTGNEVARVQSDSEDSEAVQSPTGIYISIVSNYAYVRLK